MFNPKQHANSDAVSPLEPPKSPSPVSAMNEKTIDAPARSRNSSNSSHASLRTPRTARFAEATAVHSPLDRTEAGRSPFDDPPETPRLTTNHYQPQPQPADIGFGYIADNNPSRHNSYTGIALEEPPKSPLKSALKVPGTPRRLENPLSPSFKQEQILEKHEEETEKANAKDLKVKYRVRVAKMVLRSVNFSCSLIVLSMLASTFSIFNATRHLKPRNNLPPWANNTPQWPQITLLSISCVSLAFCMLIFWNYWRSGHRRAEKTAVYYTVFAVCFFVFSIVMWAVGAGILNGSRQHGNGQDIWGWSCKDNKRKKLFEHEVSYDLVCRLQNWSLVCCIIEVVVETITILIYGVVFYRFYSKKQLRKSMDVRDRARSDLYLSQLRSQSAPNTPGYQGPMTPGFYRDPLSDAEKGEQPGAQYATPTSTISSKPFQLQPPPIKVQGATPKVQQDGFEPQATHAPAAPGERTYAAVPIPGAYAPPSVASPSFPPASLQLNLPGQAYTSESRVVSPPGTPGFARN